MEFYDTEHEYHIDIGLGSGRFNFAMKINNT